MEHTLYLVQSLSQGCVVAVEMRMFQVRPTQGERQRSLRGQVRPATWSTHPFWVAAAESGTPPQPLVSAHSQGVPAGGETHRGNEHCTSDCHILPWRMRWRRHGAAGLGSALAGRTTLILLQLTGSHQIPPKWCDEVADNMSSTPPGLQWS
jgi:hypothetical protein